MRKLSSLILSLVFSVSLFSQSSPHGVGFEVNCMDCHSTSGWTIDIKNLSFNHNTTKFALLGQHQSVNCKLCHKSLEFSKAESECVSCHTDMHNQTVGDDCARCHTPNTWVVNNITEIHQKSRFPLVGRHMAADCFDCHTNASPSLLNFGPLGVNCIDCHQKDYDATTNPNHSAGGYSTNCVECHNMTANSWSGAGINHDFFPLTGAHATISNNCFSCHQGSYVNTPNTCAGCHMPNYNASTNPNHAAINIPTDCSTCHTTNPNWVPATFAIHNNYYLLAGAHVAIANNCVDCHNGNYVTTPNTCVGCHQANYNQTTNPPHSASQFPITCTDCHTQTAWSPANWNHDSQYFPIYSGKHKNEWNACTDCHPNSTNYAVFTCTTSCHPQSSMNNEHQGITGYSYTSSACYNCHPTGSGDKMMNRIDRKE